MTASLVNL